MPASAKNKYPMSVPASTSAPRPSLERTQAARRAGDGGHGPGGTLYRYVAREIVLYSCLGFVAITAVLLGQNLVRRLDDLVFIGLSLPDLLAVVGCLMPVLTANAVPLAFLVGTLLAVRRIASDAELTAMRASGQGTACLLAPALVIGLAISALTAYLVIEVEPTARRELRMDFQTDDNFPGHGYASPVSGASRCQSVSLW